MMRALDPLGWFKWPSLLLIASPLAAYPFWSPEPTPGADCGLVTVEGRAFRVFRAPDDASFTLRPTIAPARPAPAADIGPAIGFDAGGMVVDAADPALAGRHCVPAQEG